jgi:hypothetical protein
MTWLEYGLNFGMMVHKHNGNLLTAGGNFKYLNGLNLFYANLNRFNGYIQDTLIDIKELRGNIRSSQFALGAGKGFGLDAGISYRRAYNSEVEYEGYYVHSTKSNCVCLDYLYKASLSLLDLGYIKFKEQTTKGNVDGSLYVPNYNDAGPADSLIEANFKTTIAKEVPVTAVLPTGLSAQLDMNMTHHVYLNVTAMKSVIHASMTGVQRANFISVTPRFETRNFEAALPLTFHRFLYPQLGFAFRIRSFVLGFDNLFPLFLPKKTYGVNVYFNIGISMFRGPGCKPKRTKTKPQKVRKWVTGNCPKFGKRSR